MLIDRQPLKVEQKIFRTKFSGHGGRRRHRNGAFGTENFRRIRQNRSWSSEIPKKRKTWKPKGGHTSFYYCNNTLIFQNKKSENLIKIEAAELRSRRDRDRLKGNGETESFKRTELAGNRQKNKNYYNNWFFSYPFLPKILVLIFP